MEILTKIIKTIENKLECRRVKYNEVKHIELRREDS